MSFTFLSCLFGHVVKELDKKTKLSFQIYVVTEWKTSNYNTHIAPYFSGSETTQVMKFGQVIKYNLRSIFSSKILQDMRQSD